MKDTLYIYKDAPQSKRDVMSRIGSLPPGSYEITVEKLSSRRSSQNNRRYWGYIVEPIRRFFSEQGQEFTREQVHEFLVGRFLPVDIHDPRTGEHMATIGGRTSKLNSAAFNEYTDRCEVFASDFGIIIEPSPHDCDMWMLPASKPDVAGKTHWKTLDAVIPEVASTIPEAARKAAEEVAEAIFLTGDKEAKWRFNDTLPRITSIIYAAIASETQRADRAESECNELKLLVHETFRVKRAGMSKELYRRANSLGLGFSALAAAAKEAGHA